MGAGTGLGSHGSRGGHDGFGALLAGSTPAGMAALFQRFASAAARGQEETKEALRAVRGVHAQIGAAFAADFECMVGFKAMALPEACFRDCREVLEIADERQARERSVREQAPGWLQPQGAAGTGDE